ncbi:MAG TPA: imidazole glycerol phosphate synthase subunit HisH [Opitutaceae bacterium]|nr:imidazole glycerol phosphate synthase subunit HisH [Opitutaceae bacterium]
MPPAPRIAVIDYGMGNLRSVARAVGAAEAEVRVITTPDGLAWADGVVFPGQGAIVDTMAFLRQSGFDAALRAWLAADRPYLGICLGLQALFETSEEGGGTPCLGVFPGRIVRFPSASGLKVPHMGWNTVRCRQPGSPLWAGLRADGEAFYFVHSFHVMPADRALILAECDYGTPFVCAIARGRCFATQFHPEKSQARGLLLYRNFVRLAAAGRAAPAR